METKSFATAALLLIVTSVLISSSNCTPLLKEQELGELVEFSAPLMPKTSMMPNNGKIQRQGRFYMGYPYGGMGYGGASATASASASAGAMGMGMGYGGYPYGGMYGK